MDIEYMFWLSQLVPMSQNTAEIAFDLDLSAEEVDLMRDGVMPGDMDDRWIGFLSHNSLDFYRSWSGIQIFHIPIKYEPDGGCRIHKIIVERDPEKYTNVDDEDDKSTIEFLISKMKSVNLRKRESARHEEAGRIDGYFVDNEISGVIEKYLSARQQLIKVGEKYPHRISGNDNMIGRIGEFIALKFLESLGQNPSLVEYKSNQGYDLEDGSIFTQVKVITNENKNGRNVRLKKPWNQLLLIELGEHYKPIRIGLLTEKQHTKALQDNIGWSPTPVVKLTMLNDNGLIGRYGCVYSHDEIDI